MRASSQDGMPPFLQNLETLLIASTRYLIAILSFSDNSR